MSKTVAIIPAAGQGRRMNRKVNKQYIELLDKPVLAHTLKVFENHPLIDEIIVVAKEDEIEFCQERIVKNYDFSKVSKVIAGGSERQESVYNALKEIKEDCLVVVHDGARPLVAPTIISNAINTAKSSSASVVAVPVKDTIKRVNSDDEVTETLKRSELRAIQTPQVFKKSLLQKAYDEAFEDHFYGTDDASLVERLGVPVKVIDGSYDNIKITTAEDIEIANLVLRRRRACE